MQPNMSSPSDSAASTTVHVQHPAHAQLHSQAVLRHVSAAATNIIRAEKPQTKNTSL